MVKKKKREVVIELKNELLCIKKPGLARCEKKAISFLASPENTQLRKGLRPKIKPRVGLSNTL